MSNIFLLAWSHLFETNFEGSCKCTRTLQRAAPSPVSVKDAAASNTVFVSFIINLNVPVYVKYWQLKIRNFYVHYYNKIFKTIRCPTIVIYTALKTVLVLHSSIDGTSSFVIVS